MRILNFLILFTSEDLNFDRIIDILDIVLIANIIFE